MSLLGIADTGYIVAYLDMSEQHHVWAVEVGSQFTPPLLTCEAVISEACHLLKKRLRDGPARVMALLGVGALQVAYSLQGEEQRVADLMAKYADVPMAFADACLVRLAELHSGREVLTLDGDFLIYRQHGTRPLKVSHPGG